MFYVDKKGEMCVFYLLLFVAVSIIKLFLAVLKTTAREETEISNLNKNEHSYPMY